MKKPVKRLALIVALAIICSLAAACTNNRDDGGGTSKVGDNTDNTVTTPDESSDYLRDNLPDDLNFNNQTVNILYWSDVELPEFFADGEPGDIVNDAIYQRNLETEERIGVKLNFIGQPGRNTALNDYTNKVGNSIAAGDREFDIMAAYSQTVANLAYNGYCSDLSDTPYIDLDMPWWPATLTNEATVGGKLYFVSGDISTNVLYFMYATFFNKDLIAQFDLENPYELVAENKWTLDKYIEMCSGLYTDLNANGTKDYGDRFGTIIPWLSIDAFFYGSGLRTTDKNSDGTLIISPSYSSEKAIDLVVKLNGILFGSDDGLWMREDTGTINEQFSNGLVLLFTQRTKDAFLNFSKASDLSFGVVPVPKYDSTQENFITCVGNPFTLYSVAINIRDMDLASATLEALASAAYRTTTPAIFEVTLKIKYSEDPTAAGMYDLVREGVVFDLGRIYGMVLDNLTQTRFRNLVGSGSTSWATEYASFQKALGRLLDSLNNKLVN
ncbi:MAG: extracellular solute-binding protein [Eubacteriales bacterium]|jgi:hypothetical protein